MQVSVNLDLDLDALAWSIGRLSHEEIRQFVKVICDIDATIELEEALFTDRHRLLKKEYDDEGVTLDVAKFYRDYPELEE